MERAFLQSCSKASNVARFQPILSIRIRWYFKRIYRDSDLQTIIIFWSLYMYIDFVRRHGYNSAGSEAVIIIAALFDVWCLWAILAIIRRGRGNHGIPVLSWLIYMWLALLSRKPIPLAGEPEIMFRLLNIIILTAFHITCQFFIPSMYIWWIKHRKRLREV
jgi:hypothetical protein